MLLSEHFVYYLIQIFQKLARLAFPNLYMYNDRAVWFETPCTTVLLIITKSIIYTIPGVGWELVIVGGGSGRDDRWGRPQPGRHQVKVSWNLLRLTAGFFSAIAKVLITV